MNKLSRRFTALITSRKQKKRRHASRSLRTEQLEGRMLLASDVLYSVSTNPFDSEDVNGDKVVSPIDVLAVINALNAMGNGAQAEDVGHNAGKVRLNVDVNADGELSPIDALQIINELNAEGEHAGTSHLVAYTPIVLDANVVGPFRFGADFNDNGASGDTIVRTDSGSWIDDGFVVGGTILVSDSGEFLEVDVPRQLFTYNNPKTGTHPVTSATVRDPNNGTPVLEFDDQNSNSQFDYPDPVLVDPTPEMPLSGDEDIVFQGGEPVGIGDFSDDQRFHNNGLFTIQSVSDDTITFDSSVQLHDMSGDNNDLNATFFRPITSVGPGEDFILGMIVEDLRPKALTEVGATQVTIAGRILEVEQQRGPFAAYVDVVFDSDLVMTKSATPTLGDVTFHNFLEDSPSGSFDTPGLINEVGGVSFATPANSPTGRGQQLVWTTSFTAGNSVGIATFGSDPADLSPNNDSLLYGLNAAVSTDEIGYLPFDLTIASVLTAVNDPVTVTEGSGVTPIDVLANDTSVNGIKIITGVNPAGTSGTVAFTPTGVTYQPPAGFNGTTSFTYTISNNDGATATGTVNVTVTPINDAPVITAPSSLTATEDMTLNISGVSVTDADGNDLTVTLAVTNGSLTAGTQSGGSISLSGTQAEVNAALNALTYTPNANFDASDALVIGASDGIISPPVSRSVPITVTAVDDPTILTVPGDQTAFLGSDLVFSAANTNAITLADPDSTLTVTLSVDTGTGTLTAGSQSGAEIVLTGSASSITTQLNGLIYSFTNEAPFETTLNISVQGGTPLQDSVGITVAPPTTPFAANNSFTFVEDSGTQTLNVLANDIVDDDNTLAITQLTVGAQTVTPGNSTAVNSGTLQGMLALAANGTDVTFTSADNSNGSFSFTYTIVQSPDAGDVDAIRTATVGVTVTPVNDAPTVNVPGAQTVAEDPAAPLGIAGLSVNDIDGDTLTVTLSVANGSLNTTAPIAMSGSSVTLTGSVANINTALTGLTYTPNFNFNGSDSLTVGVNDGNGGTANGAVAISITAVNDAPTITVPGAQQLFRDVSNSLSSAISIADVDASSNNVRVNLTIGTGTLAVSQSNGVQVATITNGISLTGSVANVNLALASLTYISTVSGNFTLTVAANDLGNTGSGGGQDVTRTIAVEVLDFVPATISGEIFADADGDNVRDVGEGIGNIVVTLTGTDFRGNPVSLTTTSTADGTYSFVGVAPNQSGSPYVLTQQQSSFLLNNESTVSVNVDLQGTLTTSGDLDNSVEFMSEFEEVYRLFALSGEQPSGILFGIDGGNTISMLEGEWANGRYSNFRFVPGADGSTATLTVFDNQLGTDRVANVSTADGTLTYRGTGEARVYRVVGGPSLLSAADSEGEGDATTNGAAFARGVDAIFATGGV